MKYVACLTPSGKSEEARSCLLKSVTPHVTKAEFCLRCGVPRGAS